MKRHPGLISLSSDHQHALVQAKYLRGSSLREDSARRLEVAQGFLDFWTRSGREHFREEEEVLLPALARFSEAWTPQIQEMLRQHLIIRGWVTTLQLQIENGEIPDFELLKNLGEMFDRHVRLEEQEVFPWAEKTLPEDELLRVKQLLAH